MLRIQVFRGNALLVFDVQLFEGKYRFQRQEFKSPRKKQILPNGGNQ
jgi:hypothetical protein